MRLTIVVDALQAVNLNACAFAMAAYGIITEALFLTTSNPTLPEFSCCILVETC